MKIYGHRGASGYAPENTMEAFQMAADMGADGIELDVQLTKDEELVIFHDDSMKRTARWRETAAAGSSVLGCEGEPVEGSVGDYTLKQIQQMEVGSWKDASWKGAAIPTMEQVYQWMQQNDMLVNIEIKVPAGKYNPLLTEKTLAMAAQYGVTDRILISSFCHPALADSRRLQPEIPTGILYSEVIYHPEQYADIVGAQALHPYFYSMTATVIDDCHEKGKQVNVWTPNTEEELRGCIRRGADGLITNYPDRALKLAKEADSWKETLGSYEVIAARAGGYTMKVVPELGGQVIALKKDTVAALHEPKSQQALQAASTSYGLPVLFPPNRIDGGHFETPARAYQFPINEAARGNSLHGFLHTRAWKAAGVQKSENDICITLEFIADETTDFYVAYPHTFRAQMIYHLSEKGLEQQVIIENQSEEPMPVGLGFHSAFAIDEQTKIRASVGKRILMSERMLPTGEVRGLNEEEQLLRTEGLSPIAWSMDDHYTAEPIEYEGQLLHGAVIDRADGEIVYRVDPFYQHWMIWNAGCRGDLICIEPQNWRVNAPNLVREGMSAEEAGFTLLAPGASLTASAQIQIRVKA